MLGEFNIQVKSMTTLIADFVNLLPVKLSLKFPEPILRKAYERLYQRLTLLQEVEQELQLPAKRDTRQTV